MSLEQIKDTSLVYEKFYMPGDAIGLKDDLKKSQKVKKIVIGHGIYCLGEDLIASLPGYLCSQKNGSISMLSEEKKYIPKENDFVIGVISRARGESYTVNLSFNISANLPFLSFQNATKKFRPELNPGDVVYARVTCVDPNTDIEISCIPAPGEKDNFGPLVSETGYLLTVSTSTTLRILTKNSKVAKKIENIAPNDCDVVVGMNGRLWLSAYSLAASIKLASSIMIISSSLEGTK